MRAMRFDFSRRSSALSSLFLYLLVDMTQNLHTWLLEHTDWTTLTTRDFRILGNGIALSGLLLVKSHISTSWHKPNPAAPQNANPQ